MDRIAPPMKDKPVVSCLSPSAYARRHGRLRGRRKRFKRGKRRNPYPPPKKPLRDGGYGPHRQLQAYFRTHRY